MKRLLGIISLVFCALLMSCSNGISDKTGDINFSFNAADFIRGSDEGNTTGISEYTFLVQVKGSRNYYDYQIQTVRVENNNANMDGGQQNYPFPGGNAVFGVYDPYGDYIQNNELSFTFGYVPANQKYTVMLDMFAKQDDKNYLVLSGKSRDVEVKRGQPASVELDMGGFTNSPLYINVEYEDGINSALISNYHCKDPTTTNYSNGGTVHKKYGKLWYEAPNNDVPQPIKSIGYILDPNSNFPESSYKYSIPYGWPNLYEIVETPSWKEFTFDGDRYSLEDFLLNYRDFPAGYASIESEGRPNLIIGRSAEFPKISKGNFSFVEYAPVFKFKSEDEVISGHIGDKPMSFTNTPYQDSEKHAFLKYEDISSFLNFTDEETSKLFRSSVVLVLTLKGNPSLPSNELFYKMVDEELVTYDEDNVDGGDLFSFSHNIQFNSGERKIIIPLNQIQESKTKLLLFMRNDNNSSSLTCNFDIDYYIFPSSMSAFVFNIKPQESGYRYELDESISEIWEGAWLENNGNYKANFRGNFCKFNLSDKKFTPVSVTVNSELYYFVDRYTTFTSGEDGKNGNVKSFTTLIPEAYDSKKTYHLKFPNINEPRNDSGDKFQCYTDCFDTNQLLVVRDYALDFETYGN